MNVYVFKAALWCEGCIHAFKDENEKPEHVDENDEGTYDSDEWPKGPTPDGGGESDSPQHCDGCGGFLENPLTVVGYDSVAESIEDSLRATLRLAWQHPEHHKVPVLTEWFSHYGFKLVLKNKDDDGVTEIEIDLPE